jgi:hypothetical protein
MSFVNGYCERSPGLVGYFVGYAALCALYEVNTGNEEGKKAHR